MALAELPSIAASDHAQRESFSKEQLLVVVQPLGHRSIDAEAENLAPRTPSLMFHVKHPLHERGAMVPSIERADDDEPIRILAPRTALNPVDAGDGVVDDLPLEGVHRLELLLLAGRQRSLGRFACAFFKPGGSPLAVVLDIDEHPDTLIEATPDDVAGQFLNRIERLSVLADQQGQILRRPFEDVDIEPFTLLGRLRDRVDVHLAEEFLDEVRNRVSLFLEVDVVRR
ncbi:MAG TPA: hypothetical protein VI276_06965, partial [Actinomycetota bacterium]